MIEFDRSLHTRHSIIDFQHRHLIDIFNKVETEIDNSNDSIRYILNELLDYACYHFDTEEELFEKYKYPYADEHIIEHKEYINKVNEFIKNYTQKNNIEKQDIANFLIEWIIVHIKDSDQKYAKYFREKGIFPCD